MTMRNMTKKRWIMMKTARMRKKDMRKTIMKRRTRYGRYPIYS